MKQLYLIAPPCEGTMEGFPGSLTIMKNYLDRTLGDNPSQILDLEAERLSDLPRYIEDRLPKEREFIAGITATTATYQRALETARQIKSYNPQAITVIGGHHVKKGTGQDEVVLRSHPEIDYVCTGDGEKTLEALMQGQNRSEIPNVTYLNEDSIQRSDPYDLSQDEIRTPFRIYETKSKTAKFDEGVSYPSSRGCHFKCSFCAVGKEKIRTKTVEDKVDDLKYLVLDKRYKQVAFEDNFFASDLGKTSELLKKIVEERDKDPEFRFNWTCQTRADHLEAPNSGISLEEMTDLIVASGANKIYLGIENFDPKMLIRMGKVKPPRDNLTGEEFESYRSFYESRYIAPAFRATETILQNPNVETGVLFILGMPNETRETEEINLQALEKIGRTAYNLPGRAHVYQSLSVVYPGTHDTQRLLLETDPTWTSIFEDYTKWEQGNGNDPDRVHLREFMRDNFAHGAGGIPWGILDLEEMSNRRFKIDRNKLRRVEGYLGKIRALQGKDGCDLEIHSYVSDLQRAHE